MRLPAPPYTPALLLLLACAAAARAQSAPLPDSHELLERALANEKKLAGEQERYECRVTENSTETDKDGKVKRNNVEVKEQFFVNGVPISRTLSKNGKDLTSDQVHKEDERVMKETLKYSDKAAAAKEQAKQQHQIEDVLAAMTLANGRRQQENGRSVLFYDIVPNPNFQAQNVNQRLAAAVQGTVSLDEQSGEMIDLNIKSVKDVKVAGGLVGSLSKGFWLRVHNHQEPDGIWLNDLSEGTGDVRALLFLHPYFHFKVSTGGCHLYTATASQTGPAKTVQ